MICRGFLFYNEQKTSKKQQHPHFFSLFFSLIKKGCKCITTQTPKTKKYSRLLQNRCIAVAKVQNLSHSKKRCNRFTTPTPPNYNFILWKKAQSSISSSLLAISLPGPGIIVIFTKSSFVSCSNLVDANFGIT